MGTIEFWDLRNVINVLSGVINIILEFDGADVVLAGSEGMFPIKFVHVCLINFIEIA